MPLIERSTSLVLRLVEGGTGEVGRSYFLEASNYSVKWIDNTNKKKAFSSLKRARGESMGDSSDIKKWMVN